MSLHTVWIAIEWAYNNLFSFNNWGFPLKEVRRYLVQLSKSCYTCKAFVIGKNRKEGIAGLQSRCLLDQLARWSCCYFDFYNRRYFEPELILFTKDELTGNANHGAFFSMWVSRVDESRCQPREVVNSRKGTRHLCFNLRAFFCGFFVSYNNDEWRFGALFGTSHFGAQASRLQH